MRPCAPHGARAGVARTLPIDVTLSGIGLRDTRATYLDPHAVPSGGDWALQRSAAVVLDGTENVRLENLTMQRCDGNAIAVNVNL